MFFVFDGLDGSGKSTQVDRLCTYLKTHGEVVTCKDPGSTALGEALRSILLEKGQTPIDMRSEMMLFTTARTQLVQEIIKPAIQRGAFVVLDRFVMSTVVYQGHAGKLNPEDIRTVNRFATDGVTPDQTFVFDVPVATAMERIGTARDRMESRGEDYFSAVRQGFLAEAADDPASTLIDGTAAIETIESNIRAIVDGLLKQRTPSNIRYALV